jgi:chromosome segregation ATPase
MNGQQFHEFITAFVIPLFALLSVVGVGLLSFGKYKDKRMENMAQAADTWKSLAESNIATCKQQVEDIEKLKDSLHDCRDQRDDYWKRLSDANKKLGTTRDPHDDPPGENK